MYSHVPTSITVLILTDEEQLDDAYFDCCIFPSLRLRMDTYAASLFWEKMDLPREVHGISLCCDFFVDIVVARSDRYSAGVCAV